ncbi:hypothetical protein QR680_012206 [Steinernema hermaphroditum]|uniref:poly(A)-specific ribonuclease n=1 Tax=Steinernema hermaphroditum TaxID=289476 RepID=A0AA39I1A6_9BILA|nr:hypothetical protein QR680_012206 [Steinernema hermaphroditum]
MADHLEEQEILIVNVWNGNLEAEFIRIREMIEKFPYVAMDTEFPGVVYKPLDNFFKSKEDYTYKMVTCNVDNLKLIQVGFALMNEKGELPYGNTVWQFNFHYDLRTDASAKSSIELLKNCQIDFARHQSEGIRMCDFGCLLTTSGLVCDERITWITYHSAYDFSYLMRTMILSYLPKEEANFFKLLRCLFPNSYDVKLLAEHVNIRGGLQDLANQLGVRRHGIQHQAGSDSLLTGRTFFALKEVHLKDTWNEVAPKVKSHIYGMSNVFSSSQYHYQPSNYYFPQNYQMPLPQHMPMTYSSYPL